MPNSDWFVGEMQNIVLGVATNLSSINERDNFSNFGRESIS